LLLKFINSFAQKDIRASLSSQNSGEVRERISLFAVQRGKGKAATAKQGSHADTDSTVEDKNTSVKPVKKESSDRGPRINEASRTVICKSQEG